MTGVLGISGFGSIGKRHARVASEDGWRVIVFDSVASVDAKNAGFETVSRFEELLDGPSAAVVLATPDAAHAEQAIACCERGKPVLVEKPLADSVEAAGRIVEAQARTGTAVLCGYVLRFNAALRQAAAMIAEGALGDIAGFQASVGAYETLTLARNRFAVAAPDRLYADYSHEWDYVRWLFGPISRVCAASRTVTGLDRVEEPNTVDALLTARDATGSVHLDYVQSPARRHLSVFGSAASMDIRLGSTPRITTVYADGREEVRRFAGEPDVSMTAQLRNLREVAHGQASPAVDALSGLAALEVTEAAIRSVSHGTWETVGGAPELRGTDTESD